MNTSIGKFSEQMYYLQPATVSHLLLHNLYNLAIKLVTMLAQEYDHLCSGMRSGVAAGLLGLESIANTIGGALVEEPPHF